MDLITQIANVGLTIFFLVMIAIILVNMDNWGKND